MGGSRDIPIVSHRSDRFRGSAREEIDMAHIRRHPKAKDHWQVRYVDPSGRERARNFARKSDAEKFVVTVEADKLRGEWIDPRLSKITFHEWVDRWWNTMAHLKPYTLEGYESLLRVHIMPVFGSVSLGRIHPIDIREWMAQLHSSGLSASRMRQAYYLVAQILRSAVESGYLNKTPCIGVSLPRMQPREARYLTADEVWRIAESIREPCGTLVFVLAYGGLRWGEAAALRREGCELLRSRLHVTESLSEVRSGFHFGPTKTYQRRTVVVPAFLRDLLAEHLAHRVGTEPNALVFTAPKGGPLRRKGFASGYWKPALELAGIEHLRVHDLRHTCASLLIATGANPKAVQAHLGHSSIQVTFDRYGHLFPSDQEALAARMDEVYLGSQTDTRRTPDGHQVLDLPDRLDASG
jgi:integrase